MWYLHRREKSIAGGERTPSSQIPTLQHPARRSVVGAVDARWRHISCQAGCTKRHPVTMNEAHTWHRTPFAVYTVHRARKLTNYTAGYETDRKAWMDMIQPCYSTLYADIALQCPILMHVQKAE